MRKTGQEQEEERPTPIPRTMQAVLARRGTTMASFAAGLRGPAGERWTARHLCFVANGEHPASMRLLRAIMAALTPAEWAYILGRSERLPAPPQVAAPLLRRAA